MSAPHSSKRIKNQPEGDGEKEGTAKIKSAKKKEATQSSQPHERFMAFRLTYKEPQDDDNDQFNVSKPEKGSGRMMELHNIPKVWTVKSLAKIFSHLMEIYNNSSHGTAEDTVRAIIDAALVLEPSVINDSFNTEYDPSLAKDYINKKESIASKTEFSSYIAKYTLKNTTAVKRFYYAIATGNWYPDTLRNVHDKERARILMTWLTSFLIINAYGDRDEIRLQYGKLSFSKLLTLCEADIGNVVKHFRKFFNHSISKIVVMNDEEFTSATFLSPIREKRFDADTLALQDSDFFRDLKSKDVDAGDCIKSLATMVAANSEIGLRNKVEKLKEVKGLKQVLNRQVFLLNSLESRSELDQHYKQRYEDELSFINELRTLYYQFRTKSSLPKSCSVRQFWDRLKCISVPVLQSEEDRPSAHEEQFPSENVEYTVITKVTVETEKRVADPSSLEKELEDNQGIGKTNDISYEPRKESRTKNNLSSLHRDVKSAENEVSPVAKKGKIVARVLNFNNPHEGLNDQPSDFEIKSEDEINKILGEICDATSQVPNLEQSDRDYVEEPVKKGPGPYSTEGSLHSSVSTAPVSSNVASPFQDLITFDPSFYHNSNQFEPMDSLEEDDPMDGCVDFSNMDDILKM